MTESIFSDIPRKKSVALFSDVPKAPRLFEDVPRRAASDDDVLESIQTAQQQASDDAGKAETEIRRGFAQAGADAFNLPANAFDLLDKAAGVLAEKTGTERGGAFANVAKFFRNVATESAPPAPPTEAQSTGAQILRAVGATPQMLAEFGLAFELGGPAALGTLEALREADKGEQAAKEGFVRGAAEGALFRSMEALVPVTRTSGRRAQVREAEPAQPAETSAIREQPATDVATPRQLPDRAGNINLNNLNTPDEIKSALNIVAEGNAGFVGARRGVQSNEATARLAQEFGLEDLLARSQGQAFNAEQALSARQFLVASSEDLVAKANAALGGSDEALLSFRQSLTRHTAIQEQVSGITAEAGRALQQFRIQAGSEKLRLENIKNMIESSGGRNLLEREAELLSALTNPGEISRVAAQIQKATTTDKLTEAWINGLLSGPQTHIVNAGSNSLVAAYTVPERFVQAGVGALSRSPERVRFGEAMALASGMVKGSGKAVKAAVKSFITEETPDIAGKIELPRRRAILGVKGQIIRLPGRALESSDVFFKMINYSGELEALAYRQAVKEGLSDVALKDRVTSLLSDPPEALHSAAWKKARTNTFTTPLSQQEGLVAGIGQKVNELANQHPSIRLIVPFVRTPANIFKFSAERSPFGLFMKDVQTKIKAGGTARQEALGGIAFGSAVGVYGGNLAAEGTITGGGPTERDERRLLRQTGWQPYSIRIGDTYHSFARLEPVGTLLGISGDFHEIAERLSEGERDKLGGMVAAAFARNVKNKTFLQGLNSVVRALDEPDRFAERFLTDLAGSTIPTGVAQVARADDPIIRDVRGILDRFKTRTPGLSEEVIPLLNLWGEEIKRGEGGFTSRLLNPIYFSTRKNDKVTDEMVRIGVSPSWPERNLGGVELTPEQYNDFVRTAGQQAKSILDTVVNNSTWKRLDDASKRSVIEQTIFETMAEARELMLIRHPDLLQKTLELQTQQVQ